MGAVDLDAGAAEALPQVKARTAASELARFEAVSRASLEGRAFVGDGVVSAFGGSWVDRKADPPVPTASSWVVQGADGVSRYRVRFENFDGATAQGPGVITLKFRKSNEVYQP